MNEADRIRLEHMREAAGHAIRFAAGCTREDLDEDRMRFDAIVREIEILGEAARAVTGPTRRRIPTVPWKEIVGMRHRLTHAYFAVDAGIVLNTVAMDLPRLVEVLDGALEASE